MSLIDEQIQDAIRKGQFANLPGAGKPLKLEDESHVPESLRMAHKILRDNDYVPEWIVQSQELDAAREKLIADIHSAANNPRAALLESLREAVKKHNSRVLTYNLKVPKGVVHKPYLDFEAKLKKVRSGTRIKRGVQGNRMHNAPARVSRLTLS